MSDDLSDSESFEPNNDEEVYRVRQFVYDSKTNTSTRDKATSLQLAELTIVKEEKPLKQRVLRKRITTSDRLFIWESSGGLCYLCKIQLPKLSSWHIEHVLCFSSDPDSNDVLGNMLPACQTCNLRKNSKDLCDYIRQDVTTDLMTAAADFSHLNMLAKLKIKSALEIKHDRNKREMNSIVETSRMNAIDSFDLTLLNDAISEIEENLRNDNNLPEAVTLLDSQDKYNQLPLMNKLSAADVDYDPKDRKIRNGGFGNVIPGKLKSSDVDVAIKIPRLNNPVTLNCFLREVSILARTQSWYENSIQQHPNIVKFYGYFIDPISNKLALVLEWCSNSLNDQQAINETDPLKVIMQISEALIFMHSHGIVHRDVKPGNILIQRLHKQRYVDATAKLCDFGSAKDYILNEDPSNNHTENAGTANFRSLETRKGYCIPSCDVFSLGKVMHFLMVSGNSRLSSNKNLALAWEKMTKDMTEPSNWNKRNITDVNTVRHNLWGLGGHLPVDRVSASIKKSTADKNVKQANVLSSPISKSTTDGITNVYVVQSARRRDNIRGKLNLKYHQWNCKYVSNESSRITIEEANEFGHTVCSSCSKLTPISTRENKALAVSSPAERPVFPEVTLSPSIENNLNSYVNVDATHSLDQSNSNSEVYAINNIDSTCSSTISSKEKSAKDEFSKSLNEIIRSAEVYLDRKDIIQVLQDAVQRCNQAATQTSCAQPASIPNTSKGRFCCLL